MNENEIVSEFNIRLCHIAKKFFALGEKMSEENLARNVLRSFIT